MSPKSKSRVHPMPHPESRSKRHEATIGGIHFVAEFPILPGTGGAVNLEVLGVWERWVMEELCLRGMPSGDGFKFLRQRSRIKAADLAVLFDVRPETISRWEARGSDVPPAQWDVMVQIAKDYLDGRTTTLDRLRRRQVQGSHPAAPLWPIRSWQEASMVPRGSA